MFCVECEEDLQEEGGTQFNGCYHSLCLACIKKAVKATHSAGLRCSQRKGIKKCKGKIAHEEIKYMVSEKTYNKYLSRISKEPKEPSKKRKQPQPNFKIEDADKRYGWAHKLKAIEELVSSGECHEGATEMVEQMPLLHTKYSIECSICMEEEVPPGEGAILKACMHMFCRECLKRMIEANTDFDIKCPYIDGNYSCTSTLEDQEIKALVSEEQFEKHLLIQLKFAESGTANTFHCKTPDCIGWWEIPEWAVVFKCPVCLKDNCLKCHAIHSDSCEDYQNRIVQNHNDKLSEAAIEELIQKGTYMRCSTCKLPVEKISGCDWLQCLSCKTELCWATKGPRWGPAGRGDTSAGCRCRVQNNQLCRPNCGNCH